MRFALTSLRQRKQFYPVLLILLFILSAFRFEVGCDWLGYLNQWRNIAGGGISNVARVTDPFWKPVIEFIQYMGLPYPWLNVVASAVFFCGVHVLARRQPDPLAFLVLMIPILIINMPMSAIRQGAGIGLMCIAYSAFIDRRLFRYLFWVACAAAFHKSALIFLVLAPLVNGPFSRNRLILGSIIALPGLLFLSQTDAAGLAVSRYLNSELDAQGAVFRLALIAGTGGFFFWKLQRRWKLLSPHDFKFAVIGSTMMIASLGLLPFSSVIADRLGYYLIPIQLMILARIPFLQFRASANRIFTVAPYAVFIFVFVVWISLSSLFSQCYVPYQTWLFGFPDFIRYRF